MSGQGGTGHSPLAATPAHGDKAEEAFMAFGSDQVALRTFDEVRGLELRTDGGGSSGLRNFLIHRIGQPDEVLGGFTAILETRAATAAERQEHPGIDEIATWRLHSSWGPGFDLPGYSPTESMEIYREAMRSFKWAYGVATARTRFDA